MKRVLIFSHAMELGGAERSLLGLLEVFDTERYEVDLFLMRHEGALLSEIPAKIRLLPEVPQYASLAVPIKQVLKKRQSGIALGRFLGKKMAERRRKQLHIAGDNDISLEYSHKYTRIFMPKIGVGCYDLAISFLTPHYFVRDKVDAKCKIAWIHTDYSKIAVDRESQLPMWKDYDRIIAISEHVEKNFLSTFPELAGKTEILQHFMPVEYIRRKAKEQEACEFAGAEGRRILLSIGRFSNAKNFDNVPDICRRILAKGADVRWFLIGFGSDEDLIRQKISETGMDRHVIILGKKDNPYPYIEACDLYVQPSRYEGRSISVIEAQILGKPVVITDYPTSASQLQDGFDGAIVPTNNEGCAEAIARILNDTDKMNQFSRNCYKQDYSNAYEIGKLYALME